MSLESNVLVSPTGGSDSESCRQPYIEPMGRVMTNRFSKNYVVHNRTTDQLVLQAEDGRTLRLSPLQRTRIGEDPERCLGRAALQAEQDNAVVWEPEPIRSRRIVVITWCAALGILGLLSGLALWRATSDLRLLVAGILVAVGLFVVALLVNRREDRPHSQSPVSLRPGPVRGDGWQLVRDYLIGSTQGIVLVLVLVLGIAAPGAAIYFGTEMNQVLEVRSWHDVHVPPEHYPVVVGRALLLLTVILLSLIPALMYFQFDREKLRTLIDRWLHAIFRLDPGLETVADVDAKYGRRVEEYYGAWLGEGVEPPRRRARARSPLVISTLLIGTGWILVLLDGRPPTPDGGLAGAEPLFTPVITPMTAAFLGAYFLAVQVSLRGYVRGDLRPKTYNVITVRILLAVISAWILERLFGPSTMVVAASFLAGFLPNTVLHRVREAGGQFALPGLLRRRGPRGQSARRPEDAPEDPFEDTPLTVLDGMDIYERTRLEEEGITGVQALARHDLVDLILSSRIPVPRLIDWLDQALLFQHAQAAFGQLRARGIRTATDFLQVFTNTHGALRGLKAEADVPQIDPPLLAAVLANDEWLEYVRNWRNYDVTAPPAVRRYDSRGRLTREPSRARMTWTTPAPCGQDPVSEVPPGPPATPVAEPDGTELAARGGPASPDPAGRPLRERRGQFAGNGQGTFDESQ
jgi:hypothetical protein